MVALCIKDICPQKPINNCKPRTVITVIIMKLRNTNQIGGINKGIENRKIKKAIHKPHCSFVRTIAMS
jgi:hypothetical protein